MNNFFDYVFIRIFLWYESFKDGASLATAKLLVVFLQVMLISNIIAIWNYSFEVSNRTYKLIGFFSAIVFFIFANKRYSDEALIKGLIKRWSLEDKVLRIAKGYGIVLLLIAVCVSFLLI